MKLHRAAARDDLTSVERLLADGVPVDEPDRYCQRTALHYAAESEITRPEIVSLLLAHGAQPNAPDEFGQTPLHRVTHCGSPLRVRLLLEAGGDPALRSDNYNHTPFHYVGADPAAPAIARLFLDHGAPVSAKILRWHTYLGCHPEVLALLVVRGADPEELGWSPLWRAIAFGSAEDVADALKAGPDLELRDERGRTAFLINSHFGDAEKGELLLRAGADPLASDGLGNNTALMNAAKRCDAPFVEWLLQQGADRHALDHVGKSALSKAARAGDLATVRALLEGESDPNFAEAQGEGILSSAAYRRGNEAVIRELVNAGAHVSFPGGDGYSALKSAAEEDHLENMKVLLELGAAHETCTSTALHSAVVHGSPEGVQLLLDHDAPIDAPDADGESPIFGAIHPGRHEILEILIARGANLEVVGDDGTVAFAAAPPEYLPALRRLVSAGADVNAINHWGTPLLIDVTRDGNLEGARLLIEEGADLRAQDADGRSVLDIAQEKLPELLPLLRSKLGDAD